MGRDFSIDIAVFFVAFGFFLAHDLGFDIPGLDKVIAGWIIVMAALVYLLTALGVTAHRDKQIAQRERS